MQHGQNEGWEGSAVSVVCIFLCRSPSATGPLPRGFSVPFSVARLGNGGGYLKGPGLGASFDGELCHTQLT